MWSHWSVPDGISKIFNYLSLPLQIAQPKQKHEEANCWRHCDNDENWRTYNSIHSSVFKSLFILPVAYLLRAKFRVISRNFARKRVPTCAEHPLHFYPRDAMLAWVIATPTCPSLCPSVCPSRADIVSKRGVWGVMLSSPTGSPKTLVFCRQISSPNSKGSPKEGWGVKI